MLDIHSHILPCIDDGAASVEESIELLKIMKQQGITEVIATPHFYPHEDSLADFLERRELAYKTLKSAASDVDLPNVYLGCEILYFDGMGQSNSLDELCINNSNFLLIELTDECIGNSLFENLTYLKENSGIIPIIAHTERYFRAKNYRKFLKLLKTESITVQINASSFEDKYYSSAIKKLLKSGINIIIGTDTHSIAERPPKMAEAMKIITEKFGNEYRNKILRKTNLILNNILNGDLND